MLTDSYCEEYQQRLATELLMLMTNHKPHYNQMQQHKDNKNVTISIDGMFPRTFTSIENAVKILKRENNGKK